MPVSSAPNQRPTATCQTGLPARQPIRAQPRIEAAAGDANAALRIRIEQGRLEKLFRTGIDDLPEIDAVPDLLDVGNRPAAACQRCPVPSSPPLASPVRQPVRCAEERTPFAGLFPRWIGEAQSV